MPHPTDTNNFDPLSAGVSSVTAINTALAQLSYYITQLQTGGASENVVTIELTAGESMTARDAAYLNPSDNEVYAMDASAAPAFAGTIRGFVQTTVSEDDPVVLVIGGILGGFVGLTPFLPVYADATGDGTLTQTRPVPTLDSGQVAIVPMGIAISATQVAVLPSFSDNRIRYQARYSPAQNETVTIQHGRNVDGFGRKYAAYVTQNQTITQYGSANQDHDVELQGVSAAGGSIDTNGTGSTAVLGDNAGTEAWQAQSFIAAEGRLSQVQIAFGANTGSPSGDCTLKIMEDSGGDPLGTLLHTETFTIVPSSNNTINISDGPYLDGSSTYWVRLEVPAQATNVRWNVTCSTSSTYANGTRSLSTNGGSSWTPQSSDMDLVVVTDAITKNDSLAQGIQVDEAVTVQSVRLWLKKVGSPSGNLMVKIETDSSGDPSGTPVTNGTSDTVAASSLGTSYGWITFTFSTPPSLSASTQYHLVLETADSQSDTNYVVWGADASTPGYADGEMMRERSAVWSAESADAIFQVVTDGIEYINPVAVDWYSSTVADMAAQAGDTGGADAGTKTTFKCLAAAGFGDITCEVVL